MMTEFLRTFGPWGLVLLAMAWLLKVMVSDKLNSIMKTLADLVKGREEHNERIVRIETVMGLNGCMGDSPTCGHRKGDA